MYVSPIKILLRWKSWRGTFSLGDIDHAYVYMSYCLQNALAYRNRVRVVGISAVQDTIHQIYQERNQRQEARLRMYLVLVSVLSLISLFAFLYILQADEAVEAVAPTAE